jgi:hypothetical protein
MVMVTDPNKLRNNTTPSSVRHGQSPHRVGLRQTRSVCAMATSYETGFGQIHIDNRESRWDMSSDKLI